MSEEKVEQVLVTKNIPSIHYSTGDYFHFQPGGNDAWIDEVSHSFSFVDRWMAEQDATILQLIPYIVLMKNDKKIFSYQRKGGGEKRLDGLCSIGIGGHINPQDRRRPRGPSGQSKSSSDIIGWDTVKQGAIRETVEELEIDGTFVRENLKMVGTLYAPISADGASGKPGPTAGQVHLGIVFVLPLADTIVKVREAENLINSRFIARPIDLLKYERWSQLLWQNIDIIRSSV